MKILQKTKASNTRQGCRDFLPRAAASWDACDGRKNLGTGVGAGGRWVEGGGGRKVLVSPDEHREL